MAAAPKPQLTRVYKSAVWDSTRWEQFTPRDGDIVITTSYKAGTTWMQGICAALVFQAPTPPKPQDELSPWIEANFAPIEEVIALLDGLTNRRYVKSHSPLQCVIFHDNVKYIFVGRDGPDVFMSMWNHWNNMDPEFIEMLNNAPDREGPPIEHVPDNVAQAFDDWLTKGSFEWETDGYPFWSHLDHAQSWWDFRHLDNIHVVHYNDLLKDLDGEMRKISAFLDIPVNEKIWPELVDGVTFKSMKANAGLMAPGATAGLWKDTSNFFHKGTNRRWEGVLSDDQIRRYRELAKAKLDPELEVWLEHGSAGAAR